jgi:multidrug efflux pump subunit AcrA (membrane-fusion protein)
MRPLHIAVALALTGSLVPLGNRVLRAPHAAPAAGEHVIARGPLAVSAFYEGAIESRQAAPIASRLNSSAVIMDLAAEGATVRAGDALVRFDPSSMEHDLIALERDAVLAKARLDELREAAQPLELDALELKLDDATAQLELARQLLKDTRDLRAEDLVTEQEVVQQERDALRLCSPLPWRAPRPNRRPPSARWS